jgi:hypothetical protein
MRPRPAETKPPPPPFVRRHPRLSVGVAALALACGATTLTALSEARLARSQARAAQAQLDELLQSCPIVSAIPG